MNKQIIYLKKLSVRVVEKRNARERKRVRAINEAFYKLRQMVPAVACRNKRVSKVKTLRTAVEYIKELKKILDIKDHSQHFYKLQL